MISYAQVTASNSETSQGLRWRLISDINNNCPTPPGVEGLKRKEKKPIKRHFKHGEDQGCGYIPCKAYIGSRINLDIIMFKDENMEQHLKFQRAEETLRTIIGGFVLPTKLYRVGSHAAGLDINSSDIDFTITFPGNSDYPRERLRDLMEYMENFRWRVYREMEFITTARIPVIKLQDRDTRVDIDLTFDDGCSKRNTQFLVYYRMMDPRFQPLCRAVKNWAAASRVKNVISGGLNSFSLCLMVISYLQTSVTPPILPCIQNHIRRLRKDEDVPDDNYLERAVKLRKELEEKGKFEFGANKAELGVLFAGFMKHYAEFDFQNNWISVGRGKIFEKRYSPEGTPIGQLPKCHNNIVVQDPFIRPSWNCAGTIKKRVDLEKVQLEFKKCLATIEKRGTIFSTRISPRRMMLEEEGKREPDYYYF